MKVSSFALTPASPRGRGVNVASRFHSLGQNLQIELAFPIARVRGVGRAADFERPGGRLGKSEGRHGRIGDRVSPAERKRSLLEIVYPERIERLALRAG